MQCPSCGAGIADNAMRCEFCNRPIDLPSTQAGLSRGAVARPPKFHVEDDGLTLRIWWRWFHFAVLFLLPFAIAWNAFLIGWYSMAVGGMGDAPFGMRLIFLVFPIAHVAVGLGLIYAVLTMLLNKSVLLLDRGELTIKHGPIPWPGVRLDSSEIDQLYCTITPSKNNQQSSTFALQARLKDGTEKKLLSNLMDRQDALYLEQAIEKHLKIRDVPVSGELPRG